MSKYENTEPSARALANFGQCRTHYDSGCCAFCEVPLRERSVRVGLDVTVDSFLCDQCGRVFMEGPMHLLVEVGRREKCQPVRSATSTMNT